MVNYEETWNRKDDKSLLNEKAELINKLDRLVALPSIPPPTPAVYSRVDKYARSDDLLIKRAALVAKLQRLK